MKKIKVSLFEAFAGIGAQYFALKKLPELSVDHTGISEWDIRALIAFNEIHFSTKKIKKISREKAINHLSEFDFSMDGIHKYNIENLDTKTLISLFNAHLNSNNFGSVQNLSKLNTDEKLKKSDIFTYSFPCQDLATGGKGLGMKKGSGTRSGLLWELENHLINLKKFNKEPDILIMENVRTIYSHTHIKDLDLWLNFLDSIGYENHPTLLLNASDFGVPQNRKRAFVISINKNIKVDLKKVEERINNYKKPKNEMNIFDFIGLNRIEEEEDQAWLNRTPSRERMWEINQKKLEENPILGTITCNLDRSNNSGMFAYKDSYRLLTMREAFRLMGFDDESYERVKNLGLSYRQINKLIGNSIAINVLEVVFKSLVYELYSS